ncbi:MAG: FKBP-type peptidyl-prolyl cis-trans isomerase FkpA precursor [uncultured Segetibacter sp.]|uniref:Peptidyl-prolyl cis-trans isomerase n=1 Tax=uncultured Segetibacter sp. TaxID=481133 RepID=A0A6J4RIC8_9BACT|nr:MAG: FKBP-type peptidyl-prolyl cis-trans isomerase FkpA precursor [uncultured Segetibacter sp.]
MKDFLLVAFLIIMFSSGCSKQETGCMPVKPEAEEPQIIAYASAHGINVTRHSSGIYYEIINSGSGETPAKGSTITVGYVGKLLSDKIFDQNTSYVRKLSDLNEGWQIGIPLIKKGGRIKLIIPSAYGYGCNPKKDGDDNVVIPGNSVLFFDVNLIDLK